MRAPIEHVDALRAVLEDHGGTVAHRSLRGMDLR